ncbi:GNAT family N-acetyltransferase [Jiangella gansuensis]|uniref:GNAT family N-acetyltransferase n=1 Tax=Jiangella gansuensis TaxID=281473 RepID=UPI001B7FC953|nr:GNAT family N-acetyltransferase [Jiangella gansuensis]
MAQGNRQVVLDRTDGVESDVLGGQRREFGAHVLHVLPVDLVPAGDVAPASVDASAMDGEVAAAALDDDEPGVVFGGERAPSWGRLRRGDVEFRLSFQIVADELRIAPAEPDPARPRIMPVDETLIRPATEARLSELDVAGSSPLPSLVHDWVWGWSMCRDLPEPRTEPDGYRLEVGRQEQRVRFVMTDLAAASARAQAPAEPGTWLKIIAHREQAISALNARWTVAEPEFLMSAPIGPGRAPDIDGYTSRITDLGRFREVAVHARDGMRAASGRVAVHGDAAVIDQVETDSAHRRRGLGRLVMASLCSVARDERATRGVLVATTDGRGLYEALGWTVDSDVVTAKAAIGPGAS